MFNKAFILLLLSLFFTSFFSQAEEKNCLSLFNEKSLTIQEEVREALKDKSSFIRDYKGQAGYLRFMESLKTTKNMGYVFQIVFQASVNKERKALAWQKFQGTLKDFKKTLKQVLTPAGNLKYKGMEGYVFYAEAFYSGDMLKAYKNISAVLDKRQMRELGWQAFDGKTQEYRETEDRILNEEGNLKPEYKGMEGYALYADSFYEGDMQKTYMNVSVVLDSRRMQTLLWQAFHGRTQEYRDTKALVLDEEGNLKSEYKGMEGYLFYAEAFYAGDMQKAYANNSAVLEKNQMRSLQWQSFQGSSEELREQRSQILTARGRFKYKGMKGYALYADRFYEGNMKKTYMNISAILDREEMRAMQWQSFQGSSEELKRERRRILTAKESFEYKSMEGYALYADRFYTGDMKKTYINISAILDKEQMRELGWKLFEGSAKNYRKTKARILDNEGNLKSEYKGMEGYALYADRFYEGDMKKTYVNVSAVLGKEKRGLLAWKFFQGAAQEYRETEARILDEEGKARSEYKGMDGYALYADTFSKGNMKKAYQQISAVLIGVHETEKPVLGWKIFYSFTSEYYALKDLFERYEMEEFKDSEGQERVAREIFKGNKKRAYDSVSILREELLGSYEAFTELGWSR